MTEKQLIKKATVIGRKAVKAKMLDEAGDLIQELRDARDDYRVYLAGKEGTVEELGRKVLDETTRTTLKAFFAGGYQATRKR